MNWRVVFGTFFGVPTCVAAVVYWSIQPIWIRCLVALVIGSVFMGWLCKGPGKPDNLHRDPSA
jgi:hypothetical protein